MGVYVIWYEVRGLYDRYDYCCMVNFCYLMVLPAIDATANDRPHEHDGGIPHHMMTSSSLLSASYQGTKTVGHKKRSEDHADAAESPTSPAARGVAESAGGGARRKLNLSESGSDVGGMAGGGAGGFSKEHSSSLVGPVALLMSI